MDLKRKIDFLNHFLVFPPAIALRSDAAACLEIQFSAFLRLLSCVCLEILFSVGFKINRRSFFFYESYHDGGIEFAPYKMKEIHSLKVVEDNNIDYTYKSTDRSALNALVAQKDDCDEIIIVKNGLITDTSFTTLALFDGNRWLTPKHPLLQGTKRAQLLEAGIIQEADLTPEDLRKAEKVSLFNAMIDFGERDVTKIFLPDSAD